MSENIMIGSEVEACTSAIMLAESVSVVIIQAAPTACTNPPKFEISVADQSSRKSRWRNGAKGLLRAVAGMIRKTWDNPAKLRQSPAGPQSGRPILAVSR